MTSAALRIVTGNRNPKALARREKVDRLLFKIFLSSFQPTIGGYQKEPRQSGTMDADPRSFRTGIIAAGNTDHRKLDAHDKLRFVRFGKKIDKGNCIAQ